MRFLSKAKTIFNTVKYLKPIQIVYQIKSRIPDQDSFQNEKNNAIKIRDITLFIPELDSDEQYLSRFDVEEMLEGKVTLLSHDFIFNDEWNDGNASHLENFN